MGNIAKKSSNYIDLTFIIMNIYVDHYIYFLLNSNLQWNFM